MPGEGVVESHDRITSEILGNAVRFQDARDIDVVVDPYEVAALSAVIPLLPDPEYLPATFRVEVRPVQSEFGAISYTYRFEEDAAVLLPILGLVPEVRSTVTITFVADSGGQGSQSFGVTGNPLPPTDPELYPNYPADPDSNLRQGMPIVQKTVVAGDAEQLADGLYFCTIWDRQNFAFDNDGIVRWIVGGGHIPKYNFMRRPSNGNFLNSDDPHGKGNQIWEFNMVGRVQRIIQLGNDTHHSFQELEDGRLLVPSQYNDFRVTGQPSGVVDPDGVVDSNNVRVDQSGTYDPTDPNFSRSPTDVNGDFVPTKQDCVAVLNFEDTGSPENGGISEQNFIDVWRKLDNTRPPQPQEYNSASPSFDWLHMNQAIWPSLSNGLDLVIISCRHQGVFGFYNNPEDVNDPLAFILANHEDWSTVGTTQAPGVDFTSKLLQPVDAVDPTDATKPGTPLYNLSDPDQAAQADQDFWTWGQHAVFEHDNTAAVDGILELTCFDDGNYRSRSDGQAVKPSENWSRMVHFRINLNLMQVQKVWEWGRDEVGPRGYTTFVGNANYLENGNALINYGCVISIHGEDSTYPNTTLTYEPGLSDVYESEFEDYISAAYPESGVTSKILLQEVQPESGASSGGLLLAEFEITTGTPFCIPFTTDVENGSYFYRPDVDSFRVYKMSIMPSEYSGDTA